jgi:hypothetical protein
MPARTGHMLVALVAFLTLFALAGDALAVTVSGTVKGGQGFRVVLVQADGHARQARITTASGSFRLTTGKLARATLHLVRADGSYFGPVVLKATATRDCCTFKGSTSVKLGALALKKGYALAFAPRAGRFDTRAPYTVAARSGRPVGAGKVGRVRTGTVAGYRGAGGDLDRDGVVGAFDIDDNGNLILDNVDQTGRGEMRPSASVVLRAAAPGSPTLVSAAGPPAADPPPGTTQFHLVSNFRLPGGGGDQDVRINADIPGISDIDALAAQYLPGTLLFFMPVMAAEMPAPDGTAAELDGMGNSYIAEHAVGDVVYPLAEIVRSNWTTAGHSGGLLDLVAAEGRNGDAFIMPGAVPSEIGSGDVLVEIGANGVRYPGVLNFVFSTVPALASYQFDTGLSPTPTPMAYDAGGVPANHSVLTVPPGAKTVTLTWWRPQRKPAPGEAGTWIDMGGLSYDLPLLGRARNSEGAEIGSTPNEVGAYLSATSNGTSVPVEQYGVTDPAADAQADTAKTVSLTLSLEQCFPEWATFGPGTTFELDLEARTAFGDLSSSRVRFVLE